MHLFSIFAALSFLLAAGCGAATKGSRSTVTTQGIYAAEDARFAAMVAADTAALAGMLGDDLVYVHGSGRVETKDEFLNFIGSKAIRYLSFVPTERRVAVLDTRAAVVTGRANARVIIGGQQLEYDMRYAAVYSRAATRWQLRAWQTTRLQPPSVK